MLSMPEKNATKSASIELGQFLVSFNVKDMNKAKALYEALGFAEIVGCGSVEGDWLV